MKFKSLRSFVTLLVGVSITLAVLGLSAYFVMANSRSQQATRSGAQDILLNETEGRLHAMASYQAQRIQVQLVQALEVAKGLAAINSLMGSESEEGTSGVGLSRRDLSDVIRRFLEVNQELPVAYIAWEPNAFGPDGVYSRQGLPGHGPNGRFMPLWYRDESGRLEIMAQDEEVMENDAMQSNGLRVGEYYLCPRETLRPCITDPDVYQVGDEEVMLTSFVAPVLVDGEFRGIAGVDLTVDFIQSMLEAENRNLYQGAGEMALMAPLGGVVAHTREEARLGEPFNEVFDAALQERIRQAQHGEAIYLHDAEQGVIELYWPFTIGEVDRTWVLMIRQPEEAVLAGLHGLQRQTEEQLDRDILGMTLIGLLIAGLGLVAAWLVGESIARPLRRLAERMQDIAAGNGDLTRRLPVTGRDESARLAIQFNAFVDKMNDVLLDVRDSSDSVRVAAGEIAMGSQDLSARTETAAANLQETSASMEQLTSTVEHTAISSQQANELSRSASQVASRGGEVVSQAVRTMNDIDSSSQRIAEIVSVMDGIAFQTNLLALNASVEAARAGEQGRGFAVVAGEVRQLASRSAAAARQIKELIEDATAKTQAGSELVRAAGATMSEVVASVARVTHVLDEISAASSEQSQGIGQVNQAVVGLDRMTQQNAALVEESAAAADRLEEQALRLAATVGSFVLLERQHKQIVANHEQLMADHDR
ncbi:methyl-accepting chemotaxis protein [Halomonas salipaludis]|uniref:Methyl-accepting chemotaxis protein n=1 Tax=Halomonas salipaludis TaxID=2032625 RepID=A0A2A2ER00_9GAMM|nr:methyl-accepting chemotaxis protein [Halomonas salipaludis]PAU74787.1 methyl-accepting chemotaxis protein [Halomonas salipaludis]